MGINLDRPYIKPIQMITLAKFHKLQVVFGNAKNNIKVVSYFWVKFQFW